MWMSIDPSSARPTKVAMPTTEGTRHLEVAGVVGAAGARYLEALRGLGLTRGHGVDRPGEDARCQYAEHGHGIPPPVRVTARASHLVMPHRILRPSGDGRQRRGGRPGRVDTPVTES